MKRNKWWQTSSHSPYFVVLFDFPFNLLHSHLPCPFLLFSPWIPVIDVHVWISRKYTLNFTSHCEVLLLFDGLLTKLLTFLRRRFSLSLSFHSGKSFCSLFLYLFNFITFKWVLSLSILGETIDQSYSLYWKEIEEEGARKEREVQHESDFRHNHLSRNNRNLLFSLFFFHLSTFPLSPLSSFFHSCLVVHLSLIHSLTHSLDYNNNGEWVR